MNGKMFLWIIVATIVLTNMLCMCVANAQDTSNTHKIRLDFSEPMQRAELWINNNYTVFDTSLAETTIRDVGILPGDSAVVVYVDHLWYKTEFAIRVFNVKDTAGNVINPGKNSGWFFFNGFDSTLISSKFNLERE